MTLYLELCARSEVPHSVRCVSYTLANRQLGNSPCVGTPDEMLADAGHVISTLTDEHMISGLGRARAAGLADLVDIYTEFGPHTLLYRLPLLRQ